MYKRNSGGSCTGALIYRAAESGWVLSRSVIRADCSTPTTTGRRFDSRRWIPKRHKPGTAESLRSGIFPGGPVSLRQGPDGALYLVEYGGWFQATTNDVDQPHRLQTLIGEVSTAENTDEHRWRLRRRRDMCELRSPPC
jgi:hypothetical protein